MKEKIHSSFNQQGLMSHLGARITFIEEGIVKISCPYSNAITQQNGYFHAGVITSIVDVACGYAALSMMPAESDVLTVEFKVNFMRPTQTEEIIAVGRVIKSGKRIVVCEGEVIDANNKEVARMLATMIPISTANVL